MNKKNNFYMGITLVMFFFKIILFIPHFLKQQKLHNSNCVHIILGNQQVSLQKNVSAYMTYEHKVKYSDKGKINLIFSKCVLE